jgi:5'-nucleotidase
MSFRSGAVRARIAVAVLAVLVPSGLIAACSSDDEPSAPSTTESSASTSTTATAKELTILVTNDDGVGAQGIDVLVTALQAMPDTKVVVAAPAENQSGSSGKTTPGGAVATPTTMLSGDDATAVAGFPADSVVWALDGGIPETPQLVVSGINSGQNVGAFIQLSGTVGAARAAASRGIPALAVSAGVNDTAGFDEAAELAVAWIDEHRTALLDGSMATTPAPVANLNVPGCSAGTVRGVVEVPASAEPPASLDPIDCSAPELSSAPADDNAALAGGWASLSDIGVG